MENLLGEALGSKHHDLEGSPNSESMRRRPGVLPRSALEDGQSETNLHSPLGTIRGFLPQDQNFVVDSPESSLSLPSRFAGNNPDSSELGMVPGPMPFSLPTFHPLPPKHVALDLIEEAFASFNDFYPLFDKQDFLQEFELKYLGSTPGEPGWWACLNTVLSLAHRFRAMRTLESTHANTQSCGYMQNALAVVSELTLLQSSLPAVQALVGMATILQGTPNPQAASTLVAAAIRLAQGMGLHRNSEDPSFTEMQHEQRRRVFWIAFFLDKDISLRTGLPFAQDDDDMDAELPSTTLFDIPLYDTGLSFNMFHARIGLAVIQGQIYKRLYSVQAQRQFAGRRAAAAQELNTLLSYWRSNVPVHFEDTSTPPQGYLTVQFIHMLILRFTYVHCLTMIDRHVPLRPSEQLWTEPVLDEEGDIFESPESICIIESRKAISLIQVTPRGDYAFVWLVTVPLLREYKSRDLLTLTCSQASYSSIFCRRHSPTQ